MYMFPIICLYIHVHPCMNKVVGILDSDSKMFVGAVCVIVSVSVCVHIYT